MTGIAHDTCASQSHISSGLKANDSKLTNDNVEEEPALNSATTRQRLRAKEVVERLIADAIATNARALDLSRKKLSVFPLNLLEAKNLQVKNETYILD